MSLNLSGTRYSYDDEVDKDAPWRRFLAPVPRPSNIHFMLPDPHPSKNPYAEAAAMFPQLETGAIQGFSSYERLQPVLAAIRGERPIFVIRSIQYQDQDQNQKMLTSFNRRTTVILDVSYRPEICRKRNGVGDIKRFIITRPGVAPDHASEGQDDPVYHDWTACEYQIVKFSKEALQTPPQTPSRAEIAHPQPRGRLLVVPKRSIGGFEEKDC